MAEISVNAVSLRDNGGGRDRRVDLRIIGDIGLASVMMANLKYDATRSRRNNAKTTTVHAVGWFVRSVFRAVHTHEPVLVLFRV